MALIARPFESGMKATLSDERMILTFPDGRRYIVDEDRPVERDGAFFQVPVEPSPATLQLGVEEALAIANWLNLDIIMLRYENDIFGFDGQDLWNNRPKKMY